MVKETNIFFKKTSYNNKKIFFLITIPLMAIFILNFIFFIVGSFYDYEIMEMFEKGMSVKILRYIAVFYEQAGFSELFIAFAISAIFIFEHIWKYLNQKRGLDNNLFSWITVWAIFACFLTFLLFKMWPKFFNDYYNEINGEFYTSLRYILTKSEFLGINIFIAIYQSILLIGLILYIRIKMVKKQGFYEKQYWIKALKVLTVFGLAYGIIGGLKLLMGRDFYADIFVVLERRIEMSGMNIKIEDLNLDTSIVYQPWWVFNGLIGNIDKVSDNGFNIFAEAAFPSGHLAASTMIGMCFIFLIDPKDQKTINKTKISGIYIYLIHCLIMQITFLINGLHYLTDTSFTIMWGIIVIFLSNIIIDNIILKIENRKRVTS